MSGSLSSLGLPAYAGYGATPDQEALLMARRMFPYQSVVQPATTGGLAGAAQASTTPAASQDDSTMPSFADGGATDGTTTTAAPSTGWTQQQLIDLGLLAPGAGASGDQGSGYTGNIGQGANPNPGVDPTTGSINAGLGPGGASFPNATSMSQAAGVDPGVGKGLMSAAEIALGPVGTGFGMANTFGNVANTMANIQTASQLGVATSAKDFFSGIMGGKMSGNPTAALSSLGVGLMSADRDKLMSTGQPSAGLTADLLDPNQHGSAPGSIIGTAPGPAPISYANPATAAPATAAPSTTTADTDPNSGLQGDPDNPGDPNADTGADGQSAANDGTGSPGFAGGGITGAIPGYSETHILRSLERGSGLVRGSSPGRADMLHASVPHGGYVMPADVISGIGQGNTEAGGRNMTNMLRGSSKMPMFARGGRVPGRTNIRISAGEYYVHPKHVIALGGGSLAAGQNKLDQLCKAVRAQTVRHALSTPPPR